MMIKEVLGVRLGMTSLTKPFFPDQADGIFNLACPRIVPKPT